MTKRQRKKTESGQLLLLLLLLPPPSSCVRAMISSLSFSLLSKDSRRGAHKAHSLHTHPLYLSFRSPYVYLHSNVVKGKSHFYRSQPVHCPLILRYFSQYTTFHRIYFPIGYRRITFNHKKKGSLIEFNCINPYIYVSHTAIRSFFLRFFFFFFFIF